VRQCDNSQDIEQCQTQCNHNKCVQSARSDVLDLVLKCIEQSCSTSLETCLASVTPLVAPSSKASQLCDDWAAANMSCKRGFDKDTCLAESKIYSDDTLSTADGCTSKTCDQIGSCIGALASCGMSVVPPNDGGGTGCVDFNAGTLSSVQTTSDALPTPSGGALPDGTYVAFQTLIYNSGANSGTSLGQLAATLRISGSMFAIASDELSDRSPESKGYASGSFTLDGTTLILNATCSSGMTGAGSLQYSSFVPSFGPQQLEIWQSGTGPTAIIFFRKQ
jgi:hypothetical protein